jgi:hypothetical protein
LEKYSRKKFQTFTNDHTLPRKKQQDGLEYTFQQLRGLKKLEKNDLSGAMKTLTQTFRPVEYNDNYYENLRSKYGEPTEHGLTEEEITEALTDVPLQDINLFQFSSNQVWRRLQEQSPYTGAGFDKNKRDILWQMAGRDEVNDNKNRDELEFLEIYGVF